MNPARTCEPGRLLQSWLSFRESRKRLSQLFVLGFKLTHSAHWVCRSMSQQVG
jgi:hypothetical protein